MSYEPVSGTLPNTGGPGGQAVQLQTYPSGASYPPQNQPSSLYVGQVIIPNQSYPVGGQVYSQQPQPYIVHNATPMQGFYADPNMVQMQIPLAGRMRPQNRWSDGFCQCFSNIFPSCYCVTFFCAGQYLLAQISEKQQFWAFRSALYLFLAIWIISFIVSILVWPEAILWVPLICGAIYTIRLRLHIVKKDNIRDCAQEEGCNNCFECMQSACCTCCSICQMARHTYGYAETFAGDSDPNRKSEWTNV